ncbi:MAG: ABC transporter ATP-binding protein [Planctomycetales bacterium]|nr:ABC transporter ATP-binding protein [Planctomycetales bacterium]
MSQLLLELEHVSRFYKTVIGVGDLNLQLPPGAYGLIGPNGSGKTTLINLITGVLRPSIGSVRVLGKNPASDRRVLSKIGLCPASDILYPNISGLHWVETMTGLHGFPRTDARQRAVSSMTQLGMSDNMERPIGAYSLGMRQRTKLAQAIAHEPELLILDEPFNGLDPIGRHELAEFLRSWIEQGRNLILASHILHEVEAITTSFLLIHGGRVLASGDAREVRSMLSGFPVEIELQGTGLTALAGRFSAHAWFRGLSFSDDRQSMTIRVADQAQFLAALAQAACDVDVNVSSVTSPDGSLEGAFELLLRAHRGET